MPKATRCSTNPRHRARNILIGHNLPLALWTAWAAARLLIPGESLLVCPMDALFDSCPACGLTRAYTDLISGHGVGHPLLLIVLGLFAANAVWSLWMARRVLRAAPA